MSCVKDIPAVVTDGLAIDCVVNAPFETARIERVPLVEVAAGAVSDSANVNVFPLRETLAIELS